MAGFLTESAQPPFCSEAHVCLGPGPGAVAFGRRVSRWQQQWGAQRQRGLPRHRQAPAHRLGARPSTAQRRSALGLLERTLRLGFPELHPSRQRPRHRGSVRTRAHGRGRPCVASRPLSKPANPGSSRASLAKMRSRGGAQGVNTGRDSPAHS